MSKPLTVALVAMGLLVVSVGFEVIFDRSFQLDVEQELGWVTIGSAGGSGVARPFETRAGNTVVADRNDTIEFRLRVDNGYPWSFTEPYDVRVQGVLVAEGVISAEPRSEGTASFAIRASAFYGSAPKTVAPDTTFAYVDVIVGRSHVSGSFQIQEAS